MDEKTQHNLHFSLCEEIKNIFLNTNVACVFEAESDFVSFMGLDQSDIKTSSKNNKQVHFLRTSEPIYSQLD